MTIGALAFLSPWLLAGLLSLPIIYWLLRTVPPRPRQISFPATRILLELENRERTPAKTPWWLMLIRLLAAALVILALAEPVLNPNRGGVLKGSGPVAIVVDNTWAAASAWAARVGMIERLIADAESQNRAVAIVPTATSSKTQTVRIEAPQPARSSAAALQPQPFAPDRLLAVGALETALAGQRDASVVWLTDGIDHDGQTRAFADRLAALAGGGFSVIETGSGQEPLAAASALGNGGRLEGVVIRPGGGARDGLMLAYSQRGQRLSEAPFRLAPAETRATTTFELPLELRNQVERLEIAGERSAGSVHLLDSSSHWQRIALISGESREQAQPLLGPLYYIERAMAPFAEIVAAKDANVASAIDGAFKQNASIIVMADIGTIGGSLKTGVQDWIKRGGVLVRFAGPRLEKGGDDLIPVALRLGGRTLGGALSWSTPQPLGPIGDDSPFAGLQVPPDITVNRQVLADPAQLGPNVKVWARLKDGTPLVTASDLGRGQIILFHVTANADWSNLPLSGLFVEMLRRIAALGHQGVIAREGVSTTADNKEAASSDSNAVLAPLQTLDGFGTLRSPPPTAQAIPAASIAELKPSADNPPGYYGPDGAPRALNLATNSTTLKPLPALPSSAERRAYEGQTATPLKPHMLAAALALLLIDVTAILWMQMGGFGGGRLRPARATAATVMLIAIGMTIGLVGSAAPVAAQGLPSPGVPGWRIFPPADPPQRQPSRPGSPYDLPGDPPTLRNRPPGLPPADVRGIEATDKVTFGYVLTGDSSVDAISRDGLNGLVRVLAQRTAVEAGAPQAIDIDRDEIVFYPVLYWPVVNNNRTLSEATLAKIDAYMKEGGLIIFDTRDYGMGMPSGMTMQRGGAEGTALQRLIGRLDLPRLEPVPEGHVLTKSFYLLRSFPGRWDGGQLWVEAEGGDNVGGERRARRSDGVSSILVTSNDFASAWAMDDRSRPLYPVVPGGEAQREMSFRTGVNIVMYALTGNYKADQVHVPALLERLGQ
jgi:hypothetical protein